ncbi:MAG: efflux RND transporter periplasmic adaptor subunit [Pseudomonadota bacterium]
MNQIGAPEPQAYSGTEAKPPRRKKLWILRVLTFVLPILVIVGAVGATIGMSAFSPQPEETEDPIKALPVLTTSAKSDSVTLSVTTQGEVRARTRIRLVSQVGGRITYMSPNFIEGGRFKKGELLARVDPAEYRLRVTQNRASVSQAETVLAREQSEAELARIDWEDLGRGGDPTPLTLREPQMAEAAASLEAAKARLAEAELQLARTEIRAPFDGRVTERLADAGEFVGMNSQLGQVYATDVMDVRLPLTQNELSQTGLYLGFEAGGDREIPVTLSADIAGETVEWTGFVARTDSEFDTQSRVLHAYVEVRGAFDDPSVKPPLAPGLFVQARLAGRTLDNIVVVPRNALRGQNKVYVANADNTLSIHTVDVLSSDRDRVVLGGGITPGTSVITSPIRGAADGMPIEIVETLASDMVSAMAPKEGA